MNLSAATMNLPPEKKKSSSPPPSFSSLPDEIIVNYLARIPRSYYPRLSSVCKSFHSIISSTKLYTERSYIGSTEQCLYVCIWDYSPQNPRWFTLYQNPNRTLTNSSVTKKKKTTGKLLVPIPPSIFPAYIDSTIVVGSEIYLIGGPVNEAPSSAVHILDCRNHTWRDAPNMNVARKNALTCVYDGKIYVMGGCKGLEELWGEVFDIKTQTWERLSEPGTDIRVCSIYQIAEMEGKIKLGNAYNSYAYDPKQGKWECCVNESEMFPTSECVIDNVSYRYVRNGQSMCKWYDVKDESWKEVKGLNSLRKKYRRNGGSSDSPKLVSNGGKLLLIWQVYEKNKPNGMTKIWCAEIMLEKRNGGEVWGNVEWVDVLHTVPASSACMYSHCFVVSV